MVDVHGAMSRLYDATRDARDQRITALEAEVERLQGVLKAARAWMIGVNDRACVVHSGTSRVLEDLNIALKPAPKEEEIDG